MKTSIKVKITLELTHRRVTTDDDGVTVRAHVVPHDVFVALHRYGFSDDGVDAIVILNGEPLRLAEIRNYDTIVFKRLSPLEALAAVG